MKTVSTDSVRDQMIADLELANRSPNTIKKYLACADKFAAHYMRPPGELGRTEVRCFLLHLVRVKQASPATVRMYVAALRFLYEQTLQLPEVTAGIPWPKQPRSLPVVFSGTEVEQILRAIRSTMHRTHTAQMEDSGVSRPLARVTRQPDVTSRTLTRRTTDARRRSIPP